MTVFGHSAAGFLTGKQVFPVDYESEVSQRLVEASHAGDLKSALECIADPFVDVNFLGAVSLKIRMTEIVLHDESANEVRIDYEEFKTDVSPLFLAAHAGNVSLLRKLLSVGADVNQKLFRGFATTAAVREGHVETLEILMKAGASQPACEEALMEASWHGRARLAELLMGSDLVRPHVTVHALVAASCRGFVDVVDTLMKCGVNADAVDRVLLRSAKPVLHTNVDCPALVAAIISKQVVVVRHLLQAGARRDVRVSLGAWSWDPASGEEFRVGAGLAEPYGITWCAVEYFESTGSILRLLLQYHSPNDLHLGRTLIHHAILCGNAGAVNVLLGHGADFECPVKTSRGTEFRPIHIAARLNQPGILQSLVNAGCELNSRTDSGDTALMICARYRREECLRVLASAGTDFGLVNTAGSSAASIASSSGWGLGFQRSVLDFISAGKNVHTSNLRVFSPILFVAKSGDIKSLKSLIEQPSINLDEQDENGCSPLMIAAMEGCVEAFRLLVFAGADVKLSNKSGETAIGLAGSSKNKDLFEKVMLEFEIEKGISGPGGFYALHCAARRGDLQASKLLTGRGYDVNVLNSDGYTPLMLAAREGHGRLCSLLISCGARCDLSTQRGETALSLARRNGEPGNIESERVILDALARALVLGGACVQKHTKGGRGKPHRKVMKMVSGAGVLRWGKSNKRNVVCREAEIGPSSAFQRNRRRKGDADEPGIFRVMTTKDKEVHFLCEGGLEVAALWVRGIRLVTKESFGKAAA